jgi:hypothetical protein
MSIDLNWETLTSGPDGAALAERIRIFIHDKFQSVPLPRFIKSVTVHGFDFGTVPPQLDLKDITDPLPDFYEEELEGDEDSEEDGEADGGVSTATATAGSQQHERDRLGGGRRPGGGIGGMRGEFLRHEMAGHDLGSPFLGTSTPGILGGPVLNYFQGHMGAGSQTPLAAVAGARHDWRLSPPPEDAAVHSPSHSRNPSLSSISVENFGSAGAGVSGLTPVQALREKSSVSTLAPTSVNTSRPPTRDTHLNESAIVEEDDDEEGAGHHHHHHRERRVEDVQAVFRIQYAGDIRLNLTAEILLDYPMPSFVGIPLKLNITGLSFDGVGVLAHIRKRLHFCFLSPEDAVTAVEPDDADAAATATGAAAASGTAAPERKGRFGGLLQEIKVESEIGERHSGKQSLKNVGKVERFVLEQVRRIFEEEFVYPSFWTFLV